MPRFYWTRYTDDDEVEHAVTVEYLTNPNGRCDVSRVRLTGTQTDVSPISLADIRKLGREIDDFIAETAGQFDATLAP